MIGFLSGRLIKATGGQIILSVHGVGYELSCSEMSLREIENKNFVQLWVYTYVKEDKIQLFGFSSEREKKWFLSLIRIQGIGPKIALQILSVKKGDDLSIMIEKEDINSLASLPKIGKKTAKQMILSLKGCLKEELLKEKSDFDPSRENIASALMNLGFKKEEVEGVTDKIDHNMDFQKGMREALSLLKPQI